MSAEARLNRLYPALSAKERALLILRARKAGKEHDPKIRSTIPTQQSRELNRLIGLLCVASDGLTQYIVIVAQMIEQLSLRWCWLASLHLAALNACALAETALAATLGKREKAALRRSLKPWMARFAVSLYGDPRWDTAVGGRRTTGDGVADGLVAGVRELWPLRWRELRAAEILVDEIAQEFDGEDPLPVEVRALLDECRADLCDLKKRIEPYTGELVQEEPGEELLVRLREIVRNS
jgi:hypothetical protein